MKTQASTTLTRGGHAFRFGVALLLALLPLVSASARIHHNDHWARQEFAKAERMREALNGRPLGERTRQEYQRVIDSYRRVYFGSPSSSKADPSVVATAELMVEMGRRFDDNKILRGAIDQYRFLRKEYPGSKYRFDALFTIGEIYKDDLNDPVEARAAFEDFLHRYPRSRLVDDAHAAVKELDIEAAARERSTQKMARKRASVGPSSNTASSNTGTSPSSSGNAAAADDATDAANSPGTRRSTLPRVTGVRHWSTPDYSRVAIDVEQEVKFGSQRIANPDRIFFDLRDTTLASTLVGKTFDVDDGFLKKIRVAEFQPGRTRIVLEVDNLASYDAFLLPDPYRLIIDVHGKDTHGKQKRPAMAAAASESDDEPGEAAAATSADSQPEARRPGPGTARVGSSRGADRSRKSGMVETDLPPDKSEASNSSSDNASSRKSLSSNPGKQPSGGEVIKTTVAVQGTNRRIPKTIVPADGSSEDAELKASLPTDEEELQQSDLPTPSASSSKSSTTASSSPSFPSHRKKLHSAMVAATGPNTDTESGAHSESRVESREAIPTAAGDRSLTRALGLKIGKIVIDAGHGGHDTGTIGPNGLCEKDVVLDVAKRLGRLLESRLGAEVVYTRKDDTFVPLETRTAIANRERADLFISIHANSSRDEDARGVETYYLNFTSSPEALEVAARENAVSEKSIHELQDLVKKIALKEKIDESREFAGDVQESLYGGLSLENAGIRNRGIKKAPFIVLIGANMPSILAEISFVSNPTDERKMETSEHRQRIAESLYRGVAKYTNGLSGVKVASKIEKPEGQ